MTEDEIRDVFEAEEDEFLMFDRVSPKLSGRADVHAFILLDRLVPDDKHLIAWSEHDEFGFSVDLNDLVALGVERDALIELIRCGVRLNEHDCLAMFA